LQFWYLVESTIDWKIR